MKWSILYLVKSILDSLRVSVNKKYNTKHETSDDPIFFHGNHQHHSSMNPPGRFKRKRDHELDEGKHG